MNEETFNMSIRKFLKKVGINSQREIEKTVRDQLNQGKLIGDEELSVKATFSLEGRDDSWTIDETIKLE